MEKKFLSSIVALGIVSITTSAFALNITAFDTADNLAQALVGSGVTISNVTYTGATGASGYFTGGISAGIGIESGIVLTSGAASNIAGTSNTSDAITTSNSLAGDSDLNGLVPGYTTYDATVLSFDFTSSGDAAYFQYAFGSEEYNEYVDSSFNDVFGFFFEGTNVATLPGGSTAVSINNVNNGSNASYYNDNDPSNGTPTPFAFEYDGFTNVLTAAVTGLTVGDTYSLKLAIADAGDYILDSGVFLKAGSFSNTNPEIPEPATMLLFGTGLAGLAAVGRKKTRK